MDILRCLLEIYPDWQGSVWGDKVEDIHPHELEKRPIPTMKELEEAWVRVQTKEAERIQSEVFEKENADLLEHLKENDIKCIRAIREWIIGASVGMVSALRIYDVIAQQGRDRLEEIKLSKV